MRRIVVLLVPYSRSPPSFGFGGVGAVIRIDPTTGAQTALTVAGSLVFPWPGGLVGNASSLATPTWECDRTRQTVME